MKKIIVVIGLLMMVSTVSASDSDWWNTSYQYRMPVVLTGNTSGSQAYYQLMLNVSYNAHIQSDFDDIRFTDSSKNLLSAWLENKTNDSWATIWVNFTNTPDNGATKTYYMYYGNSEVSNYWDGENTFELYDDFNDNSIDTNKWVKTEQNGVTVEEINNELKISGTTNAGSSINDDANSRIRSINSFDNIALDVKIRKASGSYYAILSQLYYDSSNLVEYGMWKWTSPDDDDLGFYHYDNWFNAVYDFDNVVIDTNWHIYSFRRIDTNLELYRDGILKATETYNGIGTNNIKISLMAFARDNGDTVEGYFDDVRVRKYVTNPPTYEFDSEQEYTLSSESETPTPAPTPTPILIPTIEASNYVIQNQTLYITKTGTFQYRITTNQFAYGGLRNINTVICDNNLTDISGWIKVDTDQSYDADYTFFVNVNDTSYQSRIVTLKQELIDSSIISKTYRRSCWVDGYELYEYNTTVYIISVIPNPIYFYWNLEDRIIQFGDKKFNNQTLAFTQLNFDDQYEFMNASSRDEVTMKFKTVSPETASGAELKGLTGLLLNVLSKIPYIGKSLKNVLYYPLFFIQTLFDFTFTFLDIIVNDWWYALMTLEIVCIFSASRKKGYSNIIEDYIKTHVRIIKFIYEVIILNMINLIITIITTIKDMIKWW